jgi:hypothetical protein
VLQNQGRGGAETDAARQRVEEVPPPAGTQDAGSAWEGPPRRDLAQEAFNVIASSASSPFTPRAGRANMWPAALSARGAGAPSGADQGSLQQEQVFRLTQEDAPAGRVAHKVQAERVSITRFNNNEPRAQVNRTGREDQFGLDTEGQEAANLRPRWLSLQERAGQAGIGMRNTTDHQDARRDPPMLGRHYQEDERGLERGPSEGAVVFSSGASGAASGSSGALHSADVNPRHVQGERSGAMPSLSPHVPSQPVTGLAQGTAQVGQAPWT